jgi:uncharacterized iron-regulated membrane protein
MTKSTRYTATGIARRLGDLVSHGHVIARGCTSPDCDCQATGQAMPQALALWTSPKNQDNLWAACWVLQQRGKVVVDPYPGTRMTGTGLWALPAADGGFGYMLVMPNGDRHYTWG